MDRIPRQFFSTCKVSRQFFATCTYILGVPYLWYVGWSRVVAVGVLDTDSEVSVRRRMMRDDENEEVYDKRDSIMKMNVAKTTTSDDNYFG